MRYNILVQNHHTSIMDYVHTLARDDEGEVDYDMDEDEAEGDAEEDDDKEEMDDEDGDDM